MRAVALACLLLVSLAAPATAGAPASLTGFTAWTTSATRVAFVATSAGGRHGYLWVQPLGASRPSLLRRTPPIGLEEIDELAPGPAGSWGALQHAAGILDTVSARGGGARIATGVQLVFGDGSFLGYLAHGTLYQVTGAHSTPVAALGNVSVQQVAVANGTIAVRESDGTVEVLTTGGKRLAAIKANAASVAVGANRIVVSTRTRRLAVYGFGGGLVHDWPLGAAGWTAGLATDGRDAVYLGANKAVRRVRLASGTDVVVARAGTGFYFDGVSLKLVPLTQDGVVTLRPV